MNASDLFNQENNRADAIAGLISFCMTHELNYSYTEKTFSITLPTVETPPNEVEINKIVNGKRKSFNIDSWGPKGYVEGEEPDPEQPLTEGEPPKEQL